VKRRRWFIEYVVLVAVCVVVGAALGVGLMVGCSVKHDPAKEVHR
jgi:hypothetical protein